MPHTLPYHPSICFSREAPPMSSIYLFLQGSSPPGPRKRVVHQGKCQWPQCLPQGKLLVLVAIKVTLGPHGEIQESGNRWRCSDWSCYRMCWGPLCVALKEPNKSHRKIRKPRWQAQPDAKTEGSHGKSGLINTLYPLKLVLLCFL